MFIDRAIIKIKSGNGGNGNVSFRREPYVPEGGPDGGDGGKGGDIVFVGDEGLNTLMDFKYKRKYVAPNGENGMRKKKYGKKAEDVIIKVPVGTLVIDNETKNVLFDITKHNQRFIAAKGGRGGRGNCHFKNSVRQAPNFAESGTEGIEAEILLELKLLADVGLIGLPNVGKSTLLSVVTGAKPKIANYHFTTINPNLGVVNTFDSSFVMADIAGIIEGANQGAGLGYEFLKHIERTRVLLHLIDMSDMGEVSPIERFDLINNELKLYNEKMLNKPQLVVASKMDSIIEKESFDELKKYVESKGYDIIKLSSITRDGIDELLKWTFDKLSKIEKEPEDDYVFTSLKMDYEKESYKEVEVSRDNDVYVISGAQLYKIFNSTNFNDVGSLRYLYKYIEKSGAIDKMRELGLQDGDTIRIKDYEFEYLEEL